MYKIDDYKFSGKKAIIRVDFNVPLHKETLEVTDDTRIKGALPTINKIIKDGGSVILMSHLGRPKEGPEEKYSLKHVIPTLKKLLGKDVKFADDCIGASAVKLSKELKKGEILLLENLRFYKEETKGDEAFAKKLASYADVYVNDAFGTAHRAHASTTIIAQFYDKKDIMFGYLIEKELEAMDKILNSTEKPVTAIMGGAKVSDKIEIIEHLLPNINNLIIGGGMTYTFIKANGGKIGNSVCEDDKLKLAKKLLKKAKELNVNVFIPVDAVNADSFDANAKTNYSKTDETPDGWMGLDIGETTLKVFTSIIEYSKIILWNGPMGVFEFEKFAHGTSEIAKSLAKATKNGAYTLVGGGDSVAAINKNKLADKVSYVSTGGGAMLEYLEGKELPGIKIIRGSK
ncbi:MAG: phosphoglycerate kinase [Bacteroidetes bacterium GWF2_33_38]|nr:MAG: phosphoglycerate kinase [Bacteroidetes bacterium GWF2_33_38]HBX51499.1 phosphoglycerate kinase [Bacteroidales bacterium]